MEDGERRHIRLVHILANGCTKLARGVVEKHVELSKPREHKPVEKPWSLDNFLYENMKKLNQGSSQKQQKQLFPGFQKEADIQEWDLALLCHVITTCSNEGILRQDILQLKNVRNFVYHLGNTNIESEVFEQKVEVIECVVERCCEFIDKKEFTESMEACLDEFKKGHVLKNDDDYEKIRQWYENDPVTKLHQKIDGISDENRLLMEKLEVMHSDMKAKLKGVVLPETNVELIVKNCDSNKEKLISEHLVRLMKNRMTEDIPDTPDADKEKILQAARAAMEELLSGGRELVDIYQACVNFKIKCPTFENLRDLWVDCMNGKLTTAFKPLETYVRGLSGCQDVSIEVGITHFEFYRCIEAVVMEIAKTIRLENSDVFAGQSDLFREVMSAAHVEDDKTPGYRKSNITSPEDLPVKKSDEHGSHVVIRLQPTTLNQAEHLWESCQNGSFNDKLEKLSKAFEKAYGLDDLQITAKTETDSPYEDIFRNRKKILQGNEHKPIECGLVTKEKQVDDKTIQETVEAAEAKFKLVIEDTTIQGRVDFLLQANKEFQDNMRKLGVDQAKLGKEINELKQAEHTLQELDKISGHKHGVLKRDTETNMDIVKLKVSHCKEVIQNIEKQVNLKREEIHLLIQTICGCLKSVIPDLKKEVKRGLQELANRYIELTSSEILDILAAWCSNVGYVLFELKETDIDKWIFIEAKSNADESSSGGDDNLPIYNYIQSTFLDFARCTFVVTDQSDYCVRLYKEQLPKITVRWLCMDYIELRAIEVCVSFLQEADIGLLKEQHTNTKHGLQLKSAKKSLSRKKAGERFEVTFDKMELENEDIAALESPHSPTSYFDRLYRFTFCTTLDGNSYSTLSLPVVVTTDASQSCCALASAMWHCFDTDNFSQPLRRKTEVSWSRVSAMLNAKFLRICSSRALTSENLRHLKRRLMENENVPDETPVSLSRFCYEPMSATCTFSFWTWFLGNYNLVDKHLKTYWQDGLIAGFLSRRDVESKFKSESNVKSGSFVLRFSDNHFTDSVGTKSVFGYLTAIVAFKVETNGKLVTKTEAVEVAGDRKLRGKTLANILRDSMDRKGINNIYKFVFPGYTRREECFDIYCSEDRAIHGYIGNEDVLLTDLEQEMFAIKNPQQQTSRQRFPSGSSDSEDSGIASVSPSGARSLSPARDLEIGIYHHAKSVMSIPIDLQSPTTPDDVTPTSETLFMSSRNDPDANVDVAGNDIDAEKQSMVADIVRRLSVLSSTSPESFSNILNFLLSQIPKDVLEMCAQKL